jgi:hypothetical protein
MAVKNKKAAEAATDHGAPTVLHLEPKEGATLVYDGKVYATTVQVPKHRVGEVAGENPEKRIWLEPVRIEA